MKPTIDLQQQRNLHLAKIILKNNLSFAKWEDPDLNQLATMAYPETSSKSRRHFSRTVLPKMYEDFVQEKAQLIGDNFIAITSDGWDHNNQALLR